MIYADLLWFFFCFVPFIGALILKTILVYIAFQVVRFSTKSIIEYYMHSLVFFFFICCSWLKSTTKYRARIDTTVTMCGS